MEKCVLGRAWPALLSFRYLPLPLPKGRYRHYTPDLSIPQEGEDRFRCLLLNTALTECFHTHASPIPFYTHLLCRAQA